MKYISKRLLEEVTGKPVKCIHEKEYRKLRRYSTRFPAIDIKVENNLEAIRKQWIDIARVIVNKCRRDLIVPTLFTATRRIMEKYVKIDPEIPKHHAIWLDAVITELDSRKFSSFFYFAVFTVFIIYISK